MVSKISFSAAAEFFKQHAPDQKVTKIALGVLGALALALITYRRWTRPVQPNPLPPRTGGFKKPEVGGGTPPRGGGTPPAPGLQRSDGEIPLRINPLNSKQPESLPPGTGGLKKPEDSGGIPPGGDGQMPAPGLQRSDSEIPLRVNPLNSKQSESLPPGPVGIPEAGKNTPEGQRGSTLQSGQLYYWDWDNDENPELAGSPPKGTFFWTPPVPQEVQACFSKHEASLAQVYDIFGGKEAFEKLPILSWPEPLTNSQESYRDPGNHRNAILQQTNEIKESCVYRGIDKWGQPFVRINYVQVEMAVDYRPKNKILFFLEKDGWNIHQNFIRIECSVQNEKLVPKRDELQKLISGLLKEEGKVQVRNGDRDVVYQLANE